MRADQADSKEEGRIGFVPDSVGGTLGDGFQAVLQNGDGLAGRQVVGLGKVQVVRQDHPGEIAPVVQVFW